MDHNIVMASNDNCTTPYTHFLSSSQPLPPFDSIHTPLSIGCDMELLALNKVTLLGAVLHESSAAGPF
jgi:hypothetical protein